MFLHELHRSGVTIECRKNKQGKGLRAEVYLRQHSFKTSGIGREFGYRILPKQFEPGNTLKPIIPSDHSSLWPTNDSPIAQIADSVVDTALDTAESLLSETGEVTALQTHGADYAEIV